jgi:hypothetical protein
MVRKKPVMIWIERQRPRREPKFHQTERLMGVGKKTTASEAIFRRGCVFERGLDMERGYVPHQ